MSYMAKKSTKTYKSDYPVDELKISNALQRGEYLLESASLPVVVIGEVAERLYNHKKLDINEVEFGIKERHMSKYAESTLKTMAGKDWRKGFDHEGVKIYFRVIKQDRGLLERPDQAAFWGGVYKVPNPFEKYYRMRGLVK